MNRTTLVALLAFTLAAAFPLPAAAEEVSWPVKPVRILVPGGPGGVTDIRARWLAERLTPLLGQSVIVENKPGAGGNIGMEIGAHSAPDGYTLTIIHQGVMTVNPHLYSRLGYDPLADFVPITYLGVGPLLLAVHPDVRASTVAELVQLAKAKPGQLSYGSPGVGTPPYGGQAVSDLIAGHISYSIEGLTVQLPQVKAGRLRALAVTGPQRVASLPDVPTMAEAGLPGAEFQGWVGIAVPAATPKIIVARLYRDVSSILVTPEAHAWFGEAGAEARTDPPDVFAAAIRVEYAKWGKVIREAGIKIE